MSACLPWARLLGASSGCLRPCVLPPRLARLRLVRLFRAPPRDHEGCAAVKRPLHSELTFLRCRRGLGRRLRGPGAEPGAAGARPALRGPLPPPHSIHVLFPRDAPGLVSTPFRSLLNIDTSPIKFYLNGPQGNYFTNTKLLNARLTAGALLQGAVRGPSLAAGGHFEAKRPSFSSFKFYKNAPADFVRVMCLKE